MRSPSRRSAFHSTALLITTLLLLSACGGGSNAKAPARSRTVSAARTAAGRSGSTAVSTIKIACTRSFSEVALIWGMQKRFAAANGIKIDPVVGTNYADSLRAISQGDVGAAMISYQNVATLAGEHRTGIKVVAGAWKSEPDLIIARYGSGIENWPSLRGKKVGVVQGSASYMLFLLAAKSNGVNPKTINIVNLPPVGATVFSSMKQGTLDAYVSWSPVTEQGIVDGAGYIPKGISITDTRQMKNGSGVLAVGPKLLANPRLLSKLLRALVQTTRYYNTHSPAWAALAVQVTGIAPKVARLAAKDEGKSLDYRVVKGTLLGAAKYGVRFGYTKKNTSNSVMSYIDLRPLAKVLKVSPQSLWE